jgi:alpha-galactosidase
VRAAYPTLEIDSCSSGGARVDLEILERTDRVWVSDNIDPLERQHMLRWTAQLVPPEYLG